MLIQWISIENQILIPTLAFFAGGVRCGAKVSALRAQLQVILSEVFQSESLAILMGILSHMADFKNIFVESYSILHVK